MPIVITALLSFAGTNIDDILILTLLFSRAETAADKRRIVLGQYLAVLTLTFFSLFFGYNISFVPHVYIGLFGLIPIFLGLGAVWRLRNKKNDKTAGRKEAQKELVKLIGMLEKIFPADILYVLFSNAGKRGRQCECLYPSVHKSECCGNHNCYCDFCDVDWFLVLSWNENRPISTDQEVS